MSEGWSDKDVKMRAWLRTGRERYWMRRALRRFRHRIDVVGRVEHGVITRVFVREVTRAEQRSARAFVVSRYVRSVIGGTLPRDAAKTA